MAKSQVELNKISQHLIQNDFAQHLTNDLSKHQSAQGKTGKDLLKIQAFNRMLLLLGSGNATVNGWKYENDKLEKTYTQFKDTNLPIGVLLSGHTGRTYMNFGDGEKSQEVLNWITSGDKSSNKGIHDAPNPFGANLDNNLTGGEIAFTRTATHSAKESNGKIKELKGMKYGAAGMLSSARDYRNLNPLNLIKGAAALSFAAIYAPVFIIGAGLNMFNTKNRDETLKDMAKPFGLFASWAKDFSKFVIGLVTLPLYEVGCILNLKKLFTNPKSYFAAMTKPFRPSINYEHFGFNVGMGGKDADGKNGHVYLNHVKEKGIIGMGLEGTAPRTHGDLGSHSLVGATDRFSTLEGEKYSIKFNMKSGAVKQYLQDCLQAKNLKADKAPSMFSLTSGTSDYQIKLLNNFIKGQKTDETALKKAIKAIGLEVATGKDGKEYMLTSFGMKMAKEGGICPHTYDGVQINNYHNVDTVLKTVTPPKEIAYFKAATSYDDFMKQEPIFRDIDQKPLLKDNPTLSLNACVYLGALYANKDTVRLAQFANQKAEQINDQVKNADNFDKVINIYKTSDFNAAKSQFTRDDSVLHSRSKTKLEFKQQTRNFVDDSILNTRSNGPGIAG